METQLTVEVLEGNGTIGLTNRHGIVGAAIFLSKRLRVLAARGR